MPESDAERCQFVGQEGAGFDSEIEEGGAVRCEAEAQVVVRLRSPRSRSDGVMDAQKTPVCQKHGGWLQESDDVLNRIFVLSMW